MSGQLNHFYDFGPYRLDTVKRLLLKDGEPVSLTPKAFDTLVALVQSGGQLLEKEELINRVWPNSFVEEGNLTVNISTLRKVLGESRNQHRYIVTVPRRGYRFVASVREVWGEGAELILEEHTRSHLVIEGEEREGAIVDEAARPPSVAVSAPALSRLRAGWKLMAPVVLLIGLVTVGFIFNHFTGPTGWRAPLHPDQSAGLKSDRREAMNGGRPGDFCWSPDAGRVAYCSKENGAANLWVVSADGSGATRITNNADPGVNFNCLAWSPGGDRIAYVTCTGEQPAEDKQAWTLCVTDLEKSEPIFRTEMILRLVGWTATGDGLVVAAVENSGMIPSIPAQVSLSRISVAGHNRQDLARVDSAYFPTIHLSPDRRNVSYVASCDGRDDVWILSIDSGAARKISSGDPKAYYSGLSRSPGGKHTC